MYHLKTMSTQSLVRFIFLLLSFFSNSRLRSDKNTVLILNRPLFLGAGPQSSMCPGCTAKPKPTPYNFRSFDFQSVFFQPVLVVASTSDKGNIYRAEIKGAQGSANSTPSFPFSREGRSCRLKDHSSR